MAITYRAIATTTVGAGGASSITISNIPSTYTDLVVFWSGRVDNTSAYYGQFYFNGNTTGYSRRGISGNGSTTGSLSFSDTYTLIQNEGAYTANTFGSFFAYIPNYAGSTNKSWSIDAVTETNATTSYQTFYAGLWSNTAAITSITLVPNSLNFVQNSTVYVYGIKNTV